MNPAVDGVFDYVVVGGGAAGCVLASRLTEQSEFRVLLIEAGPDTPPGAEPADILDVYPKSYSEPRYMWPDLLVKFKDANDSRSRYEQARVMGGGSSLSGMYALRGLPEDYDEWEALGARGWSWKDVLPYFVRLERDLDFDGPLHGKTGPIPVRRHRREEWPPLCRAVGTALQEKGYRSLADLNAEFGDGLGAIPMSNLPTQRVSAAMAYLPRAVRERPNLRIMADAFVEGLAAEGRRIRGVSVRHAGRVLQFEAGETILAAGALHTPAILLRAGIGPAEELRALGIAVIADLPGTGRNLQNHPRISLSAHLKREGMQPQGVRAFTFSTLRFSSGVQGCPASDMLMGMWNKSSWHALGQRIATLHVAVYKASSCGEVTLRSADPREEPDVRFRLLSDRRDLLRLAQGLRLLANVMDHPAVASIRNELFVPAATEFIRRLNRPCAANRIKAACAALLLDGPASLRRALIERVGPGLAGAISDAAATEEFVQRHVGCMFHPVGTCRMGDPGDRAAVVDPRLRVHGVAGLRVVDGSVMPSIVRANTHIPITMIAEKASDLIKADSAAR